MKIDSWVKEPRLGSGPSHQINRVVVTVVTVDGDIALSWTLLFHAFIKASLGDGMTAAPAHGGFQVSKLFSKHHRA